MLVFLCGGLTLSFRNKPDLGAMKLLNWVYNKKDTDPDNAVDPAYIERLQDDMRIAVRFFPHIFYHVRYCVLLNMPIHVCIS